MNQKPKRSAFNTSEEWIAVRDGPNVSSLTNNTIKYVGYYRVIVMIKFTLFSLFNLVCVACLKAFSNELKAKTCPSSATIHHDTVSVNTIRQSSFLRVFANNSIHYVGYYRRVVMISYDYIRFVLIV